MTAKPYGHASASVSLFCSLLFWLGLGLSYASRAPQINLTPSRWLIIELVAVVFAGIAAVCHAKIWPIALSLALCTLFFTLYVIAS